MKRAGGREREEQASPELLDIGSYTPNYHKRHRCKPAQRPAAHMTLPYAPSLITSKSRCDRRDPAQRPAALLLEAVTVVVRQARQAPHQAPQREGPQTHLL